MYKIIFANKIKSIKKLAQRSPRVFPARSVQRHVKRIHMCYAKLTEAEVRELVSKLTA